MLMLALAWTSSITKIQFSDMYFGMFIIDFILVVCFVCFILSKIDRGRK